MLNIMSKITLIRGLPGSGKSTLANKMAMELSSIYYEADMYWVRPDGFYDFNASLLKEAHKWCLSETELSIEEGWDVIVSNTFTTFKEIQPYIRLANDLGCELDIITLTDNYGNVHNVPEHTISRMAERFESHEAIMEKVNVQS